MSTEIGADSVIVTHSPMTPAAADAFRVFWETMGDNATWLETPEAQRKILDYVTNEAVQDYIFQWEDPAPLESNEDLPPFPVDGMPEILKSTVTELAEELQVPVDLVAVMALAVLSASLVGRVRIGVHGGWEEQVTIYALGLAESGNRKSGVVKGLKAALDNAEKAVRETTESERVKKVIARSAAESLAKNLEGRANKSTDPMDLAIHIQAAQARAEAEAIEVPHEADLVLTDATPEGMLIRMHHNGGRQAVFDAESDGLMTMAGVRYGTGNSSNIGLLLASHVGDSISQTRVGRDDVKIENPVLSIGILSQPDTLRALAGVPGSKGRGLVDRFLIAAPPDRLGYRRSQTTPMSENTKAAFTGLITAYAVTLWSAATQTIRMSEEAREAILAYQDSCEERLRPGGDLRAMNGFGGKLVGSVARLAALHHLAHYGPAAGFAMPVHENSVQWAISAAEWSLEHYRYAVGQVGEVGSVSDAERVLNWLRNRTRRTAIVAQRDVQRECRFADAEQTKNALEILADHNWVRLGKTRKASNGRPPLNWEVHPSLVGEGMDAAA